MNVAVNYNSVQWFSLETALLCRWLSLLNFWCFYTRHNDFLCCNPYTSYFIPQRPIFTRIFANIKYQNKTLSYNCITRIKLFKRLHVEYQAKNLSENFCAPPVIHAWLDRECLPTCGKSKNLQIVRFRKRVLLAVIHIREETFARFWSIY